MSLMQLLLSAVQSGYNLLRSVRFRASASASLSRTPATTTNRQTWTWSAWVKLGNFSDKAFLQAYSGGTTQEGYIRYSGNQFAYSDGVAGVSTDIAVNSSAVLRDPSAWYHLMVVANTTSATASERIQLYINGSRVTALSSATYPAQNFNTGINRNVITRIGVRSGTSEYFDGYMAEINFIDGQALTPASFGSTNALTGVWQPAPYTGTYGTNGFYLKFTDNSTAAALGTDFSGNSNTWTVNNISVTAGTTYDSMTDVPTLTSATAANYAVLNPLNKNGNAALSAGNLTVFTASNDVNFTASTIAMVANNKYYFELTCQTVTASNFYQAVGIWSIDQFRNFDSGVYTQYYAYDGRATFYNGSAGSGAYGATWTNGDVIGVAVDMTAGSMVFYKNGVSQGTATTTINTALAYYATIFTYTTQASINFGQRPFAYTPPTGFVALNTFNLPTSTIVKGNTVMDATLYTGTGAAQTITNAGTMQPDFVWVKRRSSASNHFLADSVRGVTKALLSDATDAEYTNAQYLTAFNSNGFSIGTDSGYNASGQTYVGWQWKAGGAAVTNTTGTISAQVSANPTAGFSVATYTGTGANATVGHGLGVAPKMIIVKQRSGSFTWRVYHASLANTQVLYLSDIDAATTETTAWNSTTPTSTVFSVGTSSGTNANANTYVAYCWSEIDGFSKFGSYTGNGSTDGAFIYTGFRPEFVMFKRTSGVSNWGIVDSSRSVFNVCSNVLFPDVTDAELSSGDYANFCDLLSNGFKPRSNSTNANISGSTYIYMAFAENPFKNSLAR